jgi:hypothetical protein
MTQSQREQAIRERAYAIWEQEEGHPKGRDLDHWLRAEAEIIFLRINELLELVKKDQKRCAEQQEDCLRMGAALYIWDQHLRMRHAGLLVATVLIAVFAMMQMLFEFGGEQADLITGGLILITGGLILLTTGAFAVYFAFNQDMTLEEIRGTANNFIGLSGRFQHVATITPEQSNKPRTETAEETFYSVMERFYKPLEELLKSKETIWKAAPLAPEWCFRKASRMPPGALLGGLAHRNPAKPLSDEASVAARRAGGVVRLG